MSQPTDEPVAATGPAAPARRGLPGGVRSMIISTVVVALAVLGWFLFVPRISSVPQTVQDVPGIARGVGQANNWDPAVPQGLPSTWSAATATNNPMDGLATWQVGYNGPHGYVAMVQTKNASTQWLQDQTDNGSKQGTVTIKGVTWTKYLSNNGSQQSLVRAEPLSGLSTVVIATANWSEAQLFAASLVPLSQSALHPSGS